MVKALSRNLIDQDDEVDVPKKFNLINMSREDLFDKELDFFIDSRSSHFFERFNIDIRFLMKHCNLWHQDRYFIKNREDMKKLKVINYCSERAVKLIQDYVNILTNDENQKQYLIQCIEEYNKSCPKANKNTVIKKFRSSNQ